MSICVCRGITIYLIVFTTWCKNKTHTLCLKEYFELKKMSVSSFQKHSLHEVTLHNDQGFKPGPIFIDAISPCRMVLISLDHTRHWEYLTPPHEFERRGVNHTPHIFVITIILIRTPLEGMRGTKLKHKLHKKIEICFMKCILNNRITKSLEKPPKLDIYNGLWDLDEHIGNVDTRIGYYHIWGP